MFKKKKSKLPLHTILRLSRELGAERISKDTALFISEYLISELEKIIQKADKFARHADRKTIMLNDVKLAIEKNKE